MIDNLLIVSEFEKHYGKRILSVTNRPGYDTTFTFEKNNDIVVAYHSNRDNQGIYCYFTAQGLSRYLFNTNNTVYNYLQQLNKLNYQVRLSRVDLFIDLENEDVNMRALYNGLSPSNKNPRIYVTSRYYNRDHEIKYRKRKLSFNSIINDGETNTIEIGRRSSDGFLRIYNKKIEQIKKKGPDLNKAYELNSWFRFEVEFKKKYAEVVTKQLMLIKSDEEYKNFIVNSILDKYSFYRAKNGVYTSKHEITKLIENSHSNNKISLAPVYFKNNELERSFQHQFNTSGSRSFLYRIFKIFGINGLIKILLLYIMDILSWKPSNEVIYWLIRYKEEYRVKYDNDINKFINENYGRNSNGKKP